MNSKKIAMAIVAMMMFTASSVIILSIDYGNDVSAEDPKSTSIDGITYEIIPGGKACVSDYRNPGNVLDVIILDTVTIGAGSYSVTEIANYAFRGCRDITSVTMSSVTKIGEGAFNDCFELKSITMPNVTKIGDNAFTGCHSIDDFEFSDANSAYYTDGKTIFTKDKTTIVACPSAYGLYTLISSVNTIGKNAFADSYITTVEMPNVTKIEENAFKDSHLSSITLQNVEMIGEGAFAGCNDLKNIVIPDTNRHYSSDGQTILTKDGTTLVACPSASGSYSVPTGVISIGKSAFCDCRELSLISMPDVMEIGDNAFENCEDLTVMTMPSVIMIGERAFAECHKLKIVSMPNVLMLSGNTFTGCHMLKNFIISDDNPMYSTDGRIIFSKDGTTLVAYPSVTEDCSIDENISVIGKSAFEDCYYLTSITMPNVLTVEENAFKNCEQLEEVTAPNLNNIKDEAFAECFRLESITMQYDVGIWNYSFRNCGSLFEVKFTSSDDERDFNALQYFDQYRKWKLPGMTTEINRLTLMFDADLSDIYSSNGKEIAIHSTSTVTGKDLYDADGNTLSGRDASGKVFSYVGSESKWKTADHGWFNIDVICVGGTVSGSGSYLENEDVTLTAEPDANYIFDHWNDDENDTDPTKAVMNVTGTYTAHFAKIMHLIDVKVHENGGGTVEGSKECHQGSTTTVKAIPSEGYEFVKWDDGCTDAERTVDVLKNETYTAIFALSSGDDGGDDGGDGKGETGNENDDDDDILIYAGVGVAIAAIIAVLLYMFVLRRS